MTFLVGGGFDYGNTRLRARCTALLRRPDYEWLADLELAALHEAIEDGPPAGAGVDGERRSAGLGRLHQAIRVQFGEALEQMRSFYAGPSRDLLDLLLSWFDTHNIVTVLRAVSHPGTATRQALLPVGWLRGPVADDALRLHEPAAAVHLLAHTTPHSDQARALREALAGYERSGDLAALERRVVTEDAARVAAGVAAAGRGAATMLRFVQRDADERNLLTALRARAALAAGAETVAAPGDPLLPGGTLPPRWFDAVTHATAPGAVLTAAADRGAWQPALRQWAISGDLPALQRTLERDTLTEKTVLFLTGDPLTIDIPVAFTAAAQVQARNLRLLGEAAAGHLTRDAVWRELLCPLEQS